MSDIRKLEIKSRLNDLLNLVEDQEIERVIPANLAATIAERVGNNFDPLDSYHKGGEYTKPGGPRAYTKDGTYTKHDFSKGSDEIKGREELIDSKDITSDLVLNPGDIEGLKTPLKLSSVLKHPDVRERLKNVIESELKDL